MNKIAFYPGCSLLGTAKEYLISTKSICHSIDTELIEIPDWSCCGASSAHSVSYDLSVLLPTRNLARAEKMGLSVVTPCAACYSRLKIAQKEIKENEGIKDKVLSILGNTGEKVKVYHLLEYIMRYKDKIRNSINCGLKGLKVVAYYGCLLTRPEEATEADNVENPVMMDELVEILGGEPVNWAMKTECCGASLSLSKTNIVKSLVDKIIDFAQRSGAEAITTACPLCQLNLEMRRSKPRPGAQERGKQYNIPVYYFTELIGIAQKNKEVNKWLGYHLVESFNKLREKELI